MRQIFILTAVMSLLIPSSLLAVTDDPEFESKLRASQVVSDAETVLVVSNVYYYPGKKGVGLLSGGKKKVKARMVFTENRYSVVSWKKRDKKYEILYSQNYSDLVSTEVVGVSPFIRIVAENKAGKFNSFELTDSKNALAPNTQKTRDANKILAAAIEGKDVKAVAAAGNLTTEDLSNLKVAEQQTRLKELEDRIARLEAGKEVEPEENLENECDCRCPSLD